MTEEATEMGMHGSDALVHFLEREHARYQLIEHEETFAAVDEARTSGSTLERVAKTVLLHDRDSFHIAVIPASPRLDLHKARELFAATGHLRLASEDEIEQEFPTFAVGALPPFSALLGTPAILDPSVLDHRHVLCSGGDHRHTLKISPREIQRLGEPLIGDICEARRALSEKQKFRIHQPEGVRMPATKKPAPRLRSTEATRARAEDNARRLEHITASLEAAQKDLGAIGGSLETGVRDLRRDVNRLLRDARRDLVKMRRAIQRDVDRLQKDLTTAATAKPPAARRARPADPNRQTSAARRLALKATAM